MKDIHLHCIELRRRNAAVRARAAAILERCANLQHQRAPAGGSAADTTIDSTCVEPVASAYDQAMETLHAMRAMLDALPLEWQIGVVKALTARTVLLAQARTQPAQAALSA